MSYATVAAHNVPPVDQQPKPDPSLLNTDPPSQPGVADDVPKLNVVPPNFKQDPHTYTSKINRVFQEDQESILESPRAPPKPRKLNRRLEEAGAEGQYIWQTLKHCLLRPDVAGGLVGLVNLGIFAGIGRAFYLRPNLRSDPRIISSTISASIAFLAIEGYSIKRYHQTTRGQEEVQRVKQKANVRVLHHLHNQILRPGLLGGLVGIVNTAVMGTLCYFAYFNWDQRWDRRSISAIAVGMLGLWSGESYLAERRRRKRV